jgi:DNA-binding transcriptional ArsR family regulator
MKPRSTEPDIAEVAVLFGDRGRAAMLFALLDGRALSASELAARAGMTPQAATAHFKRLEGGGLLISEVVGRHRLFRIASAEIAHAVEALAAIAKPARIVALPQNLEMARMREARSCYDHLAGRLGVAVTDGLVARKILRLEGKSFALSRSGETLFSSLEIDIDEARGRNRAFARACTDWTERRPHLAGSLGAALLAVFLARGWVSRNRNDRSLRIADRARVEIASTLRITL